MEPNNLQFIKNSVSLKIRMNLPKISATSKTVFLLPLFLTIFVVFALIQAKSSLAQGCPSGWCSMYDCIPDIGCVEPGGVMSCKDVGYRECTNGRWTATNKNQETPSKFHYSPMGGVGSLENFQTALAGCAASGTTALECFTGGPELMVVGGASGVTTNLFNSITTALAGPVNPEYAAQAPSGAISTVNNLIAGMYGNPPASSAQYFAYLGSNLGIVKPAYAQGIGFIGLNPVLKVWRIFRNIAYLFFVIIFVFVGFAIMFRLKIDPQTIISIQNALPKIIMALILVTFSYAIAGLLIDLIYVFISLIFAVLKPEGVNVNIGENIFAIAGNLFGGPGGLAIAANLGNQLNSFVQTIFQNLGGKILGFGVEALATAVFAIAIAFSLFRLFFSLLISYIGIIIGVIFSPLILMLEAVPGQKGLGSWLKMMLSNIIVFPVTAGIFAIATLLVQPETGGGGEIWVAPFLGREITAGNYITTLIGVGIILLAPSMVDSVKKVIGAPGIAAGIGAPIGAAAGVVLAPITYPAGVIRAGVEREVGGRVATGAGKRVGGFLESVRSRGGQPGE